MCMNNHLKRLIVAFVFLLQLLRKTTSLLDQRNVTYTVNMFDSVKGISSLHQKPFQVCHLHKTKVCVCISLPCYTSILHRILKNEFLS